MSTTIFRLHQLTTFRSYQLLTFAYVNYSLSLMSTTIFILQQLKNLLLTNMFIFHNLFVTYFVYVLSTASPNFFASTFQQPFLPAFSFFATMCLSNSATNSTFCFSFLQPFARVGHSIIFRSVRYVYAHAHLCMQLCLSPKNGGCLRGKNVCVTFCSVFLF